MDLVDIFTQQNCSPAVDPEFQECSYANANNCMCSDAVTAFNGLGMDVAIGSVLSPVTGDKPTPTLSPAPSGTQSYEKTLNSAGGFTGEGTAPAGAPLVTGWSFNTAVPSYDWFLNTGAALSIEGQG